ncbi:AGE family epimerase/isomerase [Paracoccus aestuariivivens]|uniref:AGE family epimerase/isomerase n=1 Tax=Paracoccus aestuariivivens TaxID=1820333 RepID=A0A6L6JBI7_9RHOB|nr:AGE family epimerase/isomerase [Paracoccus aestuariivivens]MTH79563.1 AGE family epimerase/isomerase [Paracoccus aestuariivivens]
MPLPEVPQDRTMRQDPEHQQWLRAEVARQVDFFRPSLQTDGSFAVLDFAGVPLTGSLQELHTTTRLVHSFALAKAAGLPDCDPVICAGMDFLWNRHRDAEHGGYVWSVDAAGVADGTKLAYGHVFVLLAAASAKVAGHPDADRLIADVSALIDRHYWDEEAGLLRDEFTRDWQPFSTYRGMNANMHGIEAMLTAYETTGSAIYLTRARRILDFFTGRIAPRYGFRLPEHYTADWQVDADYQGNPMFRPRGTTPGHSFELGRLLLQWWDLAGRPESDAPEIARRLIETALADAWVPGAWPAAGGFVYTLELDGAVSVSDRYWWPVSEAIGAMAALQNHAAQPQDEEWYRRLWAFADLALIDHARGGWFPELDADGKPDARQFAGKPDIYHSVQAALLSQVGCLSRLPASLRAARA